MNVEAIKFAEQSDSVLRPQLVGFGFEPYASLEECLAELQRRRIRFNVPRPFVAKTADGSVKTLFTNVTLSEFSDTDRPFNATTHMFISEYSREYVDVDQRRSRLRIELDRGGGGPLTIRSVQEIAVGTKAFREAHRRWQSLLSPLRPGAGGVWKVGNGPAIRLVPAQGDRLQRLVIAVRSLRQAKNFLRLNGQLGPVSQAGVIIRTPEIASMEFLLVQA